MRIPTSIALTVLLLAPALAFCQVKATGDYLARIDKNRDGRVDLVEYQDWLSYAFDARDLDRDGVLMPSEQPGGKGKPITRVAHRERLTSRFAKQDLDRDGYLSARELSAPPQ